MTEETVESRPPATDATIQVKRPPIQQALYEHCPMLFTNGALPEWLFVVPLIANGKAIGVIYLIDDDQ